MIPEAINQAYQNFLETFQQEYQAYKEVLVLEKQKKELLSAKTMVDLEPINDQMEEQLRKVFILEQNRVQRIRPVLQFFQLSPEAKIMDLIEAIKTPDNQSLMDTYQAFKNLVMELREMNELNNRILQDNIRILNMTVSMATGEREYEIDYGDLIANHKPRAKSLRVNTQV